MGCLEFFMSHAESRDICKILQERAHVEILLWESQTASPHSPGPVNDDELICRQIISPIHFDDATQKLTATAFDDASGKGLSVNRIKYETADGLQNTAELRTKQYNENNETKPARIFWGMINLSCAEVRTIVVPSDVNGESMRGFAIYDTALKTDPSHADICQIVKQKAQGRSVRSKLRDLANEFIDRKKKEKVAE
jgi:hypothetical protein